MAQKNRKRKKSPDPSSTGNEASHAAATGADDAARASGLQLGAGLVLLLIAAAASLMLVLESLGAMALPGCGEGSGCARAAASVWGKIPFVGWPLSSVGAAYFTGLLVAFLIERGRLPEVLRMLVRAGTLGSVVLVTVMFTEGYVCKYCLAVHACNLAFWLLVEFIEPGRGHVLRAGGTLVGVFVLGLAALVVFEARTERQVIADAEQQRQESTAEILQASSETRRAFTGRFHYGPEQAPIHIVMFTDFQCPDCQNIEVQVERLFSERDDVSLSTKHFPFCTDCNPRIRRNLHPNACWAAKAAEAAGIVGGNDAYWDMHFWLFSMKGLFDQVQLDAKLDEMGLDATQFYTVMQGSEVDRRIQADIQEAVSLGLYFTPMIFINGVQLRGVAAPNVLYRTVTELGARNPQPDLDAVPPPASVKYIEDWRLQPVRQFRPDFVSRTIGAESPKVDIVVWGDYLADQIDVLDAVARRLVTGRDDVRYTFRHYPVNPKCNPNVSVTYHELSCEASLAVEAAGQLAGDEAYWAMHRWVLEHNDNFTAESIPEAATAIGLDADELASMMRDSNVVLAVQEDVDAGAPLGFRAIPACFVNGRFVPRPFLDDNCIIDEIASDLLGEDVTR